MNRRLRLGQSRRFSLARALVVSFCFLVAAACSAKPSAPQSARAEPEAEAGPERVPGDRDYGEHRGEAE